MSDVGRYSQESLIETAYLLRSQVNAQRLLEAIDRLERGEGVRMTIDELKTFVQELGEELGEGFPL